MTADFRQVSWDQSVEDDCRQLIRLAVREDLARANDWTTLALVPREAEGRALLVARKSGVVAGLHAARLVADEYDPRIRFTLHAKDGDRVEPGTKIAEVSGPARSLLTAERPMLNFVGHLSGIATLTRRYVEAVAGTKARIYDTRKTLPGYRTLEKYAVRCGGGHNHRRGLFEGVLIKDNHLALGADLQAGTRFTPAEAVTRARAFLAELAKEAGEPLLVEVEVDRLDQLAEVLPTRPDIVLLDNMPAEVLREAVAMRDARAAGVELEASGGVNLTTVAGLAASGVDRISVGALTHSAEWWDVGLDWQ